MDERERDDFNELVKTVNAIALDVQTIKVTQHALKSFMDLYTNLDNRVRVIEKEGHECKNTQLIQQFMTFMIETRGFQKGQKPYWDVLRSWATAIAIGITMLFVGFISGGGGK